MYLQSNRQTKFVCRPRTQCVNGHTCSGFFSSLQFMLLSGLNFPDCIIFKTRTWLQFNTGSVLDNFNVFVVAVPLLNIFLSVTLLCDVCSTTGIKMEALRWTAKSSADLQPNTRQHTSEDTNIQCLQLSEKESRSTQVITVILNGGVFWVTSTDSSQTPDYIIQYLAFHLHLSTGIIRTHNANVHFFSENFKDINPLLEQLSNNLVLKKERYVICALTITQPRRNMAKVVVQVPAFFIPADLEWDKETPNMSVQQFSTRRTRHTHPRSKKITLPNTDYAHKNITSNFSQARSTLREDWSQRTRNMSEFLIVF